jgi:ABC-2 type transport system ATP-binding protein
MTSAICVSDLHYSYPSSAFEALRGLSFEVPFGKITGLLGPNGSGKSTSFKILSTQIAPTRGEAQVCSLPLASQASQIRRLLGVTFQSPSLDPILTIEENLKIHAALWGLSQAKSRLQIEERLKQMKLWDRRSEKVKQLSGGLARRAELAKTMIGSPKVLLLDEPTTGLDPVSRNDFWTLLREFVSPEKAILVTTHLMEEAEHCDHLIFIADGKTSASGSPDALKKSFEKDVIFLEGADLEALRSESLPLLSDSETCVLQGAAVRVETLRAMELYPLLQKNLGLKLSGLKWSRGTLADAYYKSTGKDLEA